MKKKKKEMIPLTYEENKSYKEQEAGHICEETFCVNRNDENENDLNKFILLLQKGDYPNG